MIGSIFEAIDQDFSGTISERELGFLFKTQGIKISDSELREIGCSLRIAENSQITFLDFKAAILGLNYFRDPEKLKIVFRYLDTVRDGSIDHSDIINCFRRFGKIIK
jgi:Ca2+-binding EF-hand superfamily protein